VILLVEKFTPSTQQRRDEINEAMEANVALGVFSRIAPLVPPDGRLRYGNAFRVAAEQFKGEACVLANADIIFDHTARLIESVVSIGRMVALTRWERATSPRMIGHVRDERFFSGSQDVWAWIGGDFVGIGDRIPLGYIGCDQAILGEIHDAGFEIVNPALSIKTWHNHANAARGDGELSVPGTYVYPELTTTHTTGRVALHKWPLEGDGANDHT